MDNVEKILLHNKRLYYVNCMMSIILGQLSNDVSTIRSNAATNIRKQYFDWFNDNAIKLTFNDSFPNEYFDSEVKFCESLHFCNIDKIKENQIEFYESAKRQ